MVTRGFAALKEKHEKELAERPKGSSFSSLRPSFFGLNENESIILRFVEEGDEWLGPKQHSFVKTKEKPADYKGDWKETANAVCRYDDLIGADECYICDNNVETSWGKPSYPSRKVYTIAQVREAIIGDGSDDLGGPENKGKTLFHLPKMIEVDDVDEDGKPTGQKIDLPEFVIVNQNLEKFASPLEVHYNNFGTIRDRDYQVVRFGTGVNTNYQFYTPPAGYDEDFQPDSEQWEEFVTQPLAKMGVNLLEDLQRRGSEEHYARFFDPTKEPPKPKNQGGDKKSSGSSAPKQNRSANADALAKARDRFKNLKK